MSTNRTKVDHEVIESFLNGTNPKKYVVAIEAGYNEPFANLIINDPETGKKIEKYRYKPFLWFKNDVIPLLYEGKKLKQIEGAKRHGIKTKKLKTSNEDGFTPSRLQNGYRYLVTCEKSYNDLINFFKEGGVDVLDRKSVV